MWGYMLENAREIKKPPDCMKCRFLAMRSEYPLGNALGGLDQIQLFCPFDSCPAIIDVEFAVDALGMCADCAQADHEFTGDLGTGKLGLEQSENFQLTLAERLDEGL